MLHQETERLALNCETETSFSIEAHKTTNEQTLLLNIDFDNVEDILDFSAPHVTKNTTITSPKCLPELYKVTEEPVMSLEMQPQNNFTTDEEQTFETNEVDYAIDLKNKDKRMFECSFCGRKYTWLSCLRRHLRIHTGVKPYYCPICKNRFARSDKMWAHFHRHYNDMMHHCWVCGKIYDDLEKFTNHCHSHDDNEYIKVAMGNATTDNQAGLQKQMLIAEDSIPVASFVEQMKLIPCVTNEKIDNYPVDGKCIACVKNPIYLLLHHKAISINNNAAKLTDASSSGSLMVSINVVHFLPQS